MAAAEPSSRGIGAPARTDWRPFSSNRSLRAPSASVVAAIALAGFAAAGITFALGLTNDEVDDVGIRVFLVAPARQPLRPADGRCRLRQLSGDS